MSTCLQSSTLESEPRGKTLVWAYFVKTPTYSSTYVNITGPLTKNDANSIVESNRFNDVNSWYFFGPLYKMITFKLSDRPQLVYRISKADYLETKNYDRAIFVRHATAQDLCNLNPNSDNVLAISDDNAMYYLKHEISKEIWRFDASRCLWEFYRIATEDNCKYSKTASNNSMYVTSNHIYGQANFR